MIIDVKIVPFDKGTMITVQLFEEEDLLPLNLWHDIVFQGLFYKKRIRSTVSKYIKLAQKEIENKYNI